ncbi:hypothetical protein COW81_01365 [Candidatus Campbellbacteria bacterium CG22_combo_CG10-13_8_21_14_all_36_13]|uniref:superoxide dismutase n=1 Tax=Candidatus Campbellbacteria bacterium CG22_combo_CG10-13_8_21_14_all_36_13 TaxID=1974529 RepID=A0A2H0DZU9_9BACT|nr:MAG: hypothetical protein COW81_01365 [Candidatus Campbellbacteria bacterium CG22_combo_CG10-13_8_21_14_all_36_13]
MHEYTAKTFDLPEIEGISKAQLDAHIKLYEGYVKHVNTIQQSTMSLHSSDNPNKDYMMKELWRRYGFEFNGMRNHEYYFGAIEGSPTSLNPESKLGKKIAEWGGFEEVINIIKFMSGTRGSGWVMFVYDKVVDQFNFAWVDEHQIGMLSDTQIILALDCWEHAYMIDHDTTGRGAYVESYLNAVNWSVCEKWFEEVMK